ncbi:MAG: glycine cleavage T C-terminal barrel domain-containing protein, partial [Pseudomonadota bacterium]
VAWGGRALVDVADAAAAGRAPDGPSREDWIDAQVAALESALGATLRLRMEAVSLAGEPGGVSLLMERPDGAGAPPRPWRVRSRRIVLATGAAELPMLFADNDLPGVMRAAAARDFVALYGVRPGQRAALFVAHDDAYRTAVLLKRAGVDVPVAFDPRRDVAGPWAGAARALGVEIRAGEAVTRALADPAGGGVYAVETAPVRASGRLGVPETVACDLVAVSGGWAPAIGLLSDATGDVAWNPSLGALGPASSEAAEGSPIHCVGAAMGLTTDAAWDGAIAHAAELGAALATGDDAPNPPSAPVDPADASRDMRASPLWFTPPPVAADDPATAIGDKHFIDLRSDLTLAEIERAARAGVRDLAALAQSRGATTPLEEGAAAVAAAVLADALDADPSALKLARAVEARAPIETDAPAVTRMIPTDAWVQGRGAVCETLGGWRTPLYFPRASGPGGELEDADEATIREIRTARQSVALHDASALRKILLSGPGAHHAFTALFGGLKPPAQGRCRVVHVSDDRGAVIADAVVALLPSESVDAPPAFLCHFPAFDAPGLAARLRTALTATLSPEEPGGSEAGETTTPTPRATSRTTSRATALDVTEAWAHFAVHGPKARALLEMVSDLNLDDAPPFACVETRVAGRVARVFHLVRGGGPGFEIATPTAGAQGLWDELLEAGRLHGAAPIGLAAREALRIERGIPGMGREADGEAMRVELGLPAPPPESEAAGAGKNVVRAPARGSGGAPTRSWRLVGLQSEDADEPLPIGAELHFGVSPPKGAGVASASGRVTSSCWSPTLGRAIALALLEDGESRQGDTVSLMGPDGRIHRARVTAPRFLEPDARDAYPDAVATVGEADRARSR